MKIASNNYSIQQVDTPVKKISNSSKINFTPVQDTVTFSGKHSKQSKIAGVLAALALFTAAAPKAAAVNEIQNETIPYVDTVDETKNDCENTTVIKLYSMDEAEKEAETISPSDIFRLMDSFDIDLTGMSLQTRTGRNTSLKKDIAKTLYASKNDFKLVDVFTPKYSSYKEAEKVTVPGDVFRTGDDEKISIKKSDGTIKKLNISAEKYLELFPPILKHCTGQKMNDCYLVSTLCSLMETPNGMAQILSCFDEKPDGSLVAQFPKGVSIFYVENGKKTSDYVDISDDNPLQIGNVSFTEGDSTLVNAPEGIKMLEFLYGKELVNKNQNSRTLIGELNKDEKDDAKIAELHHYYEQDLSDTRSQVIERGAYGGHEATVFNLFDTLHMVKKSNNISNLRYDLGAFLQSAGDENWDKFAIAASTFLGNEGDVNNPFNPDNPHISKRHAYYIRPHRGDDGNIVYELINPINTSYSINITDEKIISSVFNSIEAYQIK